MLGMLEAEDMGWWMTVLSQDWLIESSGGSELSVSMGGVTAQDGSPYNDEILYCCSSPGDG